MRKTEGILILALLICFAASAQNKDTLAWRIILMGDGGELKNGTHPVTDAIKRELKPDKNSIILMLGDNIYKKGLPGATDTDSTAYKEAANILSKQLAVADGSEAKVYVIPGNHDWNHSRPGGWEAVKRQQEFVDHYKNERVEFFPKGGCPGPELITISAEIILVLFDSEWWLRKYEKPKEGSTCGCDTKDELVKKFEEIGRNNAGKIIIIASHHPFYSKGPHGGYFTLQHHVFPFTDMNKWAFLPLPIVGSLYPLLRGGLGISRQDLSNKNYREMISHIETAIGGNKKTLFVAGHEHGLQLKKKENATYIVSGGGSKTTRVKKRKLDFGSSDPGFAVLEIRQDYTVTVKFYTVTKTIEKKFESVLFD
jgi:hypothetical protein